MGLARCARVPPRAGVASSHMAGTDARSTAPIILDDTSTRSGRLPASVADGRRFPVEQAAHQAQTTAARRVRRLPAATVPRRRLGWHGAGRGRVGRRGGWGGACFRVVASNELRQGDTAENREQKSGHPEPLHRTHVQHIPSFVREHASRNCTLRKRRICQPLSGEVPCARPAPTSHPPGRGLF